MTKRRLFIRPVCACFWSPVVDLSYLCPILRVVTFSDLYMYSDAANAISCVLWLSVGLVF